MPYFQFQIYFSHMFHEQETCDLEKVSLINPIPYGGGGCFSPPQTDIANYGVFCIENMLFYYLTFHITGLPNFWRKNNLKFLGGTPPSGPLKI